MKMEQRKWTQDSGWTDSSKSSMEGTSQFVLVFGGTKVLKEQKHFDSIKSFYPSADIVLCSTAGEILDTEVLDDSIVLTAVSFNSTKLKFAEAEISNAEESHESGKKLAESLDKNGLVHVMIFSDGLKVNGTSLVKGLLKSLPSNVSVTGGLVGDGANFKETLVGLNAAPRQGRIVAIGFYSKNLKVGYGSLGGWDNFGPERMITKSKNNVLYELDGKPALHLYKEYLGEQAKGLPGTGLLFPLSLRMKTDKGESEIVRTILAVDEKEQSMTFAGDMPEGTYAKLMKANFERLIDGASGAASMSKESIGEEAELAILVSCIGRKLVLKERVEEEIEAVRETVGKKAAIIGFYSYGEICPTAASEKQCQLHNQTMTITTFREP
ncbi:MAG TPA: FIST N-terminal domain-containing protein [Candidatus Nanoarchaeia archaeon]|nr:FIST N-terminal domain-containing protein [Candidatus Nanoarchaeia archaeon]